ncbi:MAG: hypothetical protein A2W93_10360 [Bacteroidetes bacterium GWF2_43_63]|nr:MAG: hypothetical protein A2W94_02110 [Bacteroidetes bacterium GWE2_42_42]OFY52924.1 MAG: hypothetical protein A2W93_10360 [Bacteroidetes bacterium GWF2_43_63]HBG70131.1 hypothetical protein [Bacteroidales bacterium]HCB62262.1 hypothetical protein [Bacteroidales bacterium]
MKNTALFILAVLMLASCAAPTRAYRSESVNYRFDGGYKSSESTKESDQLAGFNEDQMIIYNAGVGITVKNPDSASASVVAIAKKYDGYAVSVSNNYTSVRVKSEHLNSALKEIETLGKVTYKNISGEDITMEYNNLTVRLDNANKARQRYLELLAKAEDVKAALEVEKELERLNKEIDLLEVQLRNINQQVDYSLINVSIQERTQPGVLGYIFIGLYKGVKWLFVWN